MNDFTDGEFKANLEMILKETKDVLTANNVSMEFKVLFLNVLIDMIKSAELVTNPVNKIWKFPKEVSAVSAMQSVFIKFLTESCAILCDTEEDSRKAFTRFLDLLATKRDPLISAARRKVSTVLKRADDETKERQATVEDLLAEIFKKKNDGDKETGKGKDKNNT